jgi:exopolyphosphatase/guanosine-5'-triphosphate,3'-diphosphate pyrophosphatase
MRVAAIDIGTNSVLLLVAERRGTDIVPVVERATITRLGEKVDATRRLAPEAMSRTLACLARYAGEMRALGATKVDAVGTSAMRDAGGGAEFVERAREILGVAPRVISGREEAELTFQGALAGLALAAGPVTVFDVGGGSTEIVVGRSSGEVDHAESLDIGSVRLTERHVRSDPARPEEIEAVRAAVRSALAGAQVPRRALGSLVGVAGTVTTIAAYARDVVPYDGMRVHGATLSRAEVREAAARLAAMSLSERRAARAIEPARADVIVAGSVLVDEFMSWVEDRSGGDRPTNLVVSDRGVRWGIVCRMLGQATA